MKLELWNCKEVRLLHYILRVLDTEHGHAWPYLSQSIWLLISMKSELCLSN